MQIQVTEAEAEVLLKLLDGAVRHLGAPSVPAVYMWQQKVTQAFPPPPPPKQDGPQEPPEPSGDD